MISFFKRLIAPLMGHQSDAGPTEIGEIRMTLDDRKVWRRKMVYSVVRKTMISLNIPGKAYKFKITQCDERGHVYAVMIDINKDFVINPLSKVKGFIGIEKIITKNVFDEYGVTIIAVYWRTIEEKPVKIRKKTVDLKSVPVVDNIEVDDKEFSPLSVAEKEQFMQAIALGMQPKHLTVGDKEYYSDIMPFQAAVAATELDFDLSDASITREFKQFKTQPGELRENDIDRRKLK
jgi:hypothetical protein